MDPNTGEIRVRSQVDYEETSSYEMYVQAMDKGAAAVAVHCKVVVEVMDVNDNVPEIVLSSLSSPVREDARADTVVALISVTDRDSGPNKQVSLEIPPGLPFKVKSFRNYYTLVTSAFLDREDIAAYNVTLSATDTGTPPLSSKKTIQIDVADVNDNPPRFEQTSYTVYVVENNTPGASLCTVRAQDSDINENARITYTVLNDNNHGIPVTSYVSVRADTGEAYALRAFDYETLREFHFQVKAQDGGIPPLSRVATVYIYVLDQNDHAPEIAYPPANGSRPSETVLKNVEAGHLVMKISAYDADAGQNAWLLYSLEQATDPDLFKVHEHTGEIRTTRKIVEDNSTFFSLTVLVRDSGQPSLSSTATVNVAVMEVPPKMTPDPKKIIKPHRTLIFSNVTLYLIVALSATTFVFLLTVVVLAIVRCHAYCTQSGSCCPCCTSQKAPPQPGQGAGGAGGASGQQPNNNVVLRRDLKVEPHYIEVRGNGSLTKTYCYKTCLTATSGSDTFMFYNTGCPPGGTMGSERFFTGQSGQMFVRRLSMPDAALQPKPPNADWRYSASLRAGMQSAVNEGRQRLNKQDTMPLACSSMEPRTRTPTEASAGEYPAVCTPEPAKRKTAQFGCALAGRGGDGFKQRPPRDASGPGNIWATSSPSGALNEGTARLPGDDPNERCAKPVSPSGPRSPAGGEVGHPQRSARPSETGSSRRPPEARGARRTGGKQRRRRGRSAHARRASSSQSETSLWGPQPIRDQPVGPTANQRPACGAHSRLPSLTNTSAALSVRRGGEGAETTQRLKGKPV
ncbi:hypothetical protein COCON_G00054600 [Conger conger]|uniref:Cadherin domain-containing protein n=1 Tax=Conger conger TaxID=82655 RepID=A0A9Q1DWA7_CONCO|nr:hypothetical protein COCON_G00054600 [Conger conger]